MTIRQRLAFASKWRTSGGPASAVWRHADITLSYPPRRSVVDREDLQRALAAALGLDRQLTVRERRALGTTLARLGRLQDALAELDRVVSAAPDDVIARVNRGIVLKLLYRNREAVATLEPIVHANPPRKSVFLALADALAFSGRDADAIRCYQETLKLWRRDPNALRGLAQFAGRDETSPAAPTRRWTTHRWSKEPTPDPGRIRALIDSGAYREADALSRRLLSRQPDDPRAAMLRAETLGALGETETARVFVGRAIEARPDDADLRARAALLFTDVGVHDDALAQIDAAIRLARGNLAYLVIRARILEALGRTDEAVGSFDAAIAEESQDPSFYGAKAGILHRAGRAEAARATLHQGLAISPSDAGLRDRLAMVLIDLGRPKDALGVCDALLQDEPGMAGALASRASALHRLGRNQEALEAIEAAVAADARDHRAQFLLGEVLSSLDRFKEAAAAYQVSYELFPHEPTARRRESALERADRAKENLH